MANPQKENGYVPVANDIYDAFGKIRIAGEARQVLDVIIRKTYGFNKREDRIAISQLAEATGLRKQTVYKCLVKLQKMNLVTKLGTKNGNILSFQKDFDQWKPEPKKVTVTNMGTVVTNKGYKSNPKRRTQKTKDTITKDTELHSNSKEVVLVIDSFSEVNASFKKWYGHKTHRAAIERLLELNGLDRLLKVIELLPKTNELPYFPSINNPTQLEDKWSQLESAFKRKKQELTGKQKIFI